MTLRELDITIAEALGFRWMRNNEQAMRPGTTYLIPPGSQPPHCDLPCTDGHEPRDIHWDCFVPNYSSNVFNCHDLKLEMAKRGWCWEIHGPTSEGKWYATAQSGYMREGSTEEEAVALAALAVLERSGK